MNLDAIGVLGRGVTWYDLDCNMISLAAAENKKKKPRYEVGTILEARRPMGKKLFLFPGCLLLVNDVAWNKMVDATKMNINR